MKDSKTILSKIDENENNDEKKIYQTSLTKLERMNDIENNYSYDTCCGKMGTDKRLLEFGTKFIVILGILIWAVSMSLKKDNNQVYVNIIVCILSVFLPSPKISTNNK